MIKRLITDIDVTEIKEQTKKYDLEMGEKYEQLKENIDQLEQAFMTKLSEKF